MKKYNNSSQPVTKTDLENALKRFATKDDLKRFATKIDLDRLRVEIDDNAKKYRDDVLTKLDGVMGELQTMRGENTIGTYQTREIREQVDNHEKR
nr:hypothetical protein [Candidatus Levybacteria bacterium]